MIRLKLMQLRSSRRQSADLVRCGHKESKRLVNNVNLIILDGMACRIGNRSRSVIHILHCFDASERKSTNIRRLH